MTRACGPLLAVLGLAEQLEDPRIAGCDLPRLVKRLDRGLGVALAQQRLGLERLRRNRAVIELERDAHLGEHFIEPLECEQRVAEHDAAFDGRRPAEQAQPADLHGLLELPRGDQGLAAADEVALRHYRFQILRHPEARVLSPSPS